MEPVGPWFSAASYNRLTNQQPGAQGDLYHGGGPGIQPQVSAPSQLFLGGGPYPGANLNGATASPYPPGPSGFLSPQPPPTFDPVFNPLFHQKSHYRAFKQPEVESYNYISSSGSNYFEQNSSTSLAWSQNNQLHSPFGVLPHESVIQSASVSTKPFDNLSHLTPQTINHFNAQSDYDNRKFSSPIKTNPPFFCQTVNEYQKYQSGNLQQGFSAVQDPGSRFSSSEDCVQRSGRGLKSLVGTYSGRPSPVTSPAGGYPLYYHNSPVTASSSNSSPSPVDPGPPPSVQQDHHSPVYQQSLPPSLQPNHSPSYHQPLRPLTNTSVDIPPLDVSLPRSMQYPSKSLHEKNLNSNRTEEEIWECREKRLLSTSGFEIQKPACGRDGQTPVPFQSLKSCRGDPMSLVKTLQQQNQQPPGNSSNLEPDKKRIGADFLNRVPPPAHHNTFNQQVQNGYFDFERWNSAKMFSGTSGFTATQNNHTSKFTIHTPSSSHLQNQGGSIPTYIPVLPALPSEVITSSAEQSKHGKRDREALSPETPVKSSKPAEPAVGRTNDNPTAPVATPVERRDLTDVSRVITTRSERVQGVTKGALVEMRNPSAPVQAIPVQNDEVPRTARVIPAENGNVSVPARPVPTIEEELGFLEKGLLNDSANDVVQLNPNIGFMNEFLKFVNGNESSLSRSSKSENRSFKKTSLGSNTSIELSVKGDNIGLSTRNPRCSIDSAESNLDESKSSRIQVTKDVLKPLETIKRTKRAKVSSNQVSGPIVEEFNPTNMGNVDTSPKLHEKFPFSVGDFVVVKSDLSLLHPPVWRVKKNLLLQKFTHFVSRGVAFYSNVPIFTGWSPETKKIYEKVDFRIIKKRKDDWIIKLTPTNMLNISSGRNLVESRMKEYRKHREAFEIYVQALFSQALDTKFLKEIHIEKDKYFLENIQTIEMFWSNIIEKLKESVAWSKCDGETLLNSPNYQFVKEHSSRDACVCSKSTPATAWVALGGLPYSATTLELSKTPVPQQVISLCDSCKDSFELLHKLSHQKYLLFSLCDDIVKAKKIECLNKDAAVILNDLLNDNDWFNRVFNESLKLWAYAEKFTQDLIRMKKLNTAAT